MAHSSCPNGHDMWNGDGKPVVWIFRVAFFRDYMKKHPGFVLADGSIDDWQIYDCVEDVTGEDLDGWYCKKCKGLAIFTDISRYDYKRLEVLPEIETLDLSDWEDYIAMREKEFEEFQVFYENKNPIEAIESFSFIYRYKVSPDKKTILAFDRYGNVAFGYYRSNYMEFSPFSEMIFRHESEGTHYFPYKWAQGKFEIQVKPGQYAHLRDGRTMKIDSVLIPGEWYHAFDIEDKSKLIIRIKHSDIVKAEENLELE